MLNPDRAVLLLSIILSRSLEMGIWQRSRSSGKQALQIGVVHITMKEGKKQLLMKKEAMP